MSEQPVYINPVYPAYFADPFVWHHEGEYYAVGTGALEAEGERDETGASFVFPVLHSKNFVQWQLAGKALQRLDPSFGDSYWAPEVAFDGNRFYLYYSVGHEDKNHQLRVAVSDHPTGPYLDTGKYSLTPISVHLPLMLIRFKTTTGNGFFFMPAIFSMPTLQRMPELL